MFAMPVGDSSAADKGSKSKKPLVQMYDANGNGKLGPNEKIAARPARAQMRVGRALRRNAAVINGIR
jgi:hypothetical protein